MTTATTTTSTTIRTTPLPPTEHTARPWRIHELAPDFRLEDVWALPTPGGREDFSRLVEQFTRGDDERDFPIGYRFLFAARWLIGAVLRLDRDDAGVSHRVGSLRDRMPPDLAGWTGPDFDGVPFHPVYLTEREFVAEIANRTVHALLHLGWVEDGDGYRGQMAVLNKPNGAFGRSYMALIKPFRYAVVYPGLLRTIGRRWAREQGVA